MRDDHISLSDLAIIGDRRTCALLDKQGNIVWYCPKRFDNPSLFAQLLDGLKGGSWSLQIEGMKLNERRYLGESGILQTRLQSGDGFVELTDWMPLDARFYGICRQFSASPVPYTSQIDFRPNYNREKSILNRTEATHVILQFDYHLYASHPLVVEEGIVTCPVPAGEEAWFIFSEKALGKPGEILDEVRELTLDNWKKLSAHITYQGPYEEQLKKSLRMLRMLTYAENGGIIAAATTSLPEVIGGKRNYDYRYVWLRDAAMIVSALTRAGSDGEEERKFLSFVCSAMHRIPEPVVPMLTLDEQPAGRENPLDFKGFKNSGPVNYGNDANNQLQLDANSNVLIAAKLIYNRYGTREHWETVQRLANFLVEHWQEPDHGIWEEVPTHHYTSSKVITSISLKYIAEHSTDQEEKKRWRETSEEIEKYVEANCRTRNGAYAVYAGSDDVDISAVLFPLWGYTAADTEPVLKTIEVLENEYCQNNLFRRHLVEFDAKKEGAFLAGTLWMAQYWVMRKNWGKVEDILNAVLEFMNDVGIMPEEGDPETGEWLGNLPQTFVHASLIGAIIDYKNGRY